MISCASLYSSFVGDSEKLGKILLSNTNNNINKNVNKQ